jgi:hypothetical protein
VHVIDTGDIDVYLGLDVGKGEHHATALRGRNESLYPFCRRLNVWPRRLRQAAGPVLC